ncbi:MAG: hypothetical protein AB7O62_24895 [Pirellulales bacterium]
MLGRGKGALPLDLAEAARRFAGWRRTRQRGDRIPAALWNKAVGLADRYGVSRTAQALHIGYYELQKHVARRKAPTTSGNTARGKNASELSFVELPPVALAASECVVEFEKASGDKMRVKLPGSELVALARIFWEAR